jgi:hypothetical protein
METCRGTTGKGSRCTKKAIPACASGLCTMHDRAAAGAALRETAAAERAASQATMFASAAAAMGSEMGSIRRTLTDPLGTNLEVVGVVPGTRHAPTIRSAYHRRALTTHPDKGGTAVAFRRLQEAYDRLKAKIEGLH